MTKRMAWAQAFMAFILAASVLFATTAHGAQKDCSPLDVREQMSGEVRHHFMTPSNQGDTGWCFAYAAADLLTHSLDRPVSAFHIALVYSNNMTGLNALGRNMMGLNNAGFFDGGYEREAVNIMKQNRLVCLEKDVHSKNDEWSSIAAHLQSFSQALSDKADFFSQMMAADFLESRFPQVDPQGAWSFVQSQKSHGAPQALRRLSEAVCAPTAVQIPPSLTARTVRKDSGAGIVAALDSALESGRPASILFFPARFVRSTKFTNQFIQHVSVVVGRKKVGRQCMYTIRNSWGPEHCSLFKSDVPCNNKDGTFQLSAEDIERASLSTTYLNL